VYKLWVQTYLHEKLVAYISLCVCVCVCLCARAGDGGRLLLLWWRRGARRSIRHTHRRTALSDSSCRCTSAGFVLSVVGNSYPSSATAGTTSTTSTTSAQQRKLYNGYSSLTVANDAVEVILVRLRLIFPLNRRKWWWAVSRPCCQKDASPVAALSTRQLCTLAAGRLDTSCNTQHRHCPLDHHPYRGLPPPPSRCSVTRSLGHTHGVCRQWLTSGKSSASRPWNSCATQC
jgi:hypothetical protein